MNYLAEEEDIYWGVREAFKQFPKGNPRILEVGSGFGYLTYALAQRGYDIKGLEISSVAVEEATRRYGNLFICGDVFEFSQKSGPVYDVIIFTEVIEHVPTPKAFLSAINAMLSPGGKIIITTPNKTPYPSTILWETEPPPIHLWWFSEQSMGFLGKLLGHHLSFIDFTEFAIQELKRFKDYHKPHTLIRDFQPSRLPRLNAKGEVIEYGNDTALLQRSNGLLDSIKKQIKSTLDILGILKPLLKLKHSYQDKRRFQRLMRSLKQKPQNRPVLCAIFHKPVTE